MKEETCVFDRSHDLVRVYNYSISDFVLIFHYFFPAREIICNHNLPEVIYTHKKTQQNNIFIHTEKNFVKPKTSNLSLNSFIKGSFSFCFKSTFQLIHLIWKNSCKWLPSLTLIFLFEAFLSWGFCLPAYGTDYVSLDERPRKSFVLKKIQ